MMVDRGWMWRVVLLTSLIVAAVGARDKQSDVDVSDVDEDLSLDEEELKVLMAEDEDEKTTAGDDDESDVSGKDKADENVSFQVRNAHRLKVAVAASIPLKTAIMV